LRGPQGHLT